MAFSLAPHKSADIDRARDPRATGATLVGLAAHRDPAVKAAVAARADCPLASMLSLAHESDARVLEALISNPSVPRRVLEDLRSHKKARIRTQAEQTLRRTGT